MMRPFMSPALGSENTETVDSLVCSEATRWIAIWILRARSSPSSRARCSISRTVAIASRLASSTTCARSASFASDAVSRAIFSRSGAMLDRRVLELLADQRELAVPIVHSSARRSASSILRSTTRSFWVRRSSWRLISSRRVRTSSSVSRRSAPISSFATPGLAGELLGLALGLQDHLLGSALGFLGLRPGDRSSDHEPDRHAQRQGNDPHHHRYHRFTASFVDTEHPNRGPSGTVRPCVRRMRIRAMPGRRPRSPPIRCARESGFSRFQARLNVDQQTNLVRTEPTACARQRQGWSPRVADPGAQACRSPSAKPPWRPPGRRCRRSHAARGTRPGVHTPPRAAGS